MKIISHEILVLCPTEIRCPGAAAQCVYEQLCWAIWNVTAPTKMTISYDSIQEGKVSALLSVGHQIMPKSWDGLFPNLEGMLGMVRLNRQTVRHAKKIYFMSSNPNHWAYSPAAGSDQRSRCFSYGQLHAVFSMYLQTQWMSWVFQLFVHIRLAHWVIVRIKRYKK